MSEDRALLKRRERVRRKYDISEIDEPLDGVSADLTDAVDDEYYYASQWKLMWWRFRRHRMALISAFFAFPALPDGRLCRVHRAL